MKFFCSALVGAALLSASSHAQSTRQSTTAVPQAMLGCWEIIEPGGQREWIIVGRTTASGRMGNDPAFANVPLRVGARFPNSIVRTVSFSVRSPNQRRPQTYNLWMESPAALRIDGYWAADAGEPDPELSRCR